MQTLHPRHSQNAAEIYVDAMLLMLMHDYDMGVRRDLLTGLLTVYVVTPGCLLKKATCCCKVCESTNMRTSCRLTLTGPPFAAVLSCPDGSRPRPELGSGR
jgi:hypothetical protein